MVPDKRVQVKIEFGHQSISRENPSQFKTHDWTVFVKGTEGADISHIVEKVVFHLHVSFPKPKRVCKEPPYKLQESGYGSFNLPIDVFFKTNAKEDARKHQMNYDLSLQMIGLPPLNCTKIEALTFLNPSEEFERRLLKAGAVILPSDDTPKVKSEKLSPASSNGSSPGSQKKSSSSQKLKREGGGQTGSSLKRQAPVGAGEDTSSQSIKPKKKKSNEHERAATPVNNSSSNSGLKEISILSSPGDAAAVAASTDPLKAKSLSSVRKLKEERTTRRRSVDNNESPKHGKEGKHKSSKDAKIKKEKSLDLNSSGGIPKLKFSIKRTPDESWAATTVQTAAAAGLKAETEVPGVVVGGGGGDIAINNTVLNGNSTTISQQNENVRKVLAAFGEQSSDDEVAAVMAEGKLNTSLTSSSVGDTMTSSKSSKKSKHKSSKSNGHHNNKGKVIKDVDTKSNTDQGGKKALSSTELNDIFTKITHSQDTNILQGVVDIVEATGDYEISTSTFDFDLYGLNNDTLFAIKKYLQTV